MIQVWYTLYPLVLFVVERTRMSVLLGKHGGNFPLVFLCLVFDWMIGCFCFVGWEFAFFSNSCAQGRHKICEQKPPSDKKTPEKSNDQPITQKQNQHRSTGNTSLIINGGPPGRLHFFRVFQKVGVRCDIFHRFISLDPDFLRCKSYGP